MEVYLNWTADQKNYLRYMDKKIYSLWLVTLSFDSFETCLNNPYPSITYRYEKENGTRDGNGNLVQML